MSVRVCVSCFFPVKSRRQTRFSLHHPPPSHRTGSTGCSHFTSIRVAQAKATPSEPADRQVKGKDCELSRGKGKCGERKRETLVDSARVVCQLRG